MEQVHKKTKGEPEPEPVKLNRYYCEVRKRWVRPGEDGVPEPPPAASAAVPDHLFRKVFGEKDHFIAFRNEQ